MPLSLSPEQRSLRASIAANTRWSREDPKAALVKTRQGWRQKFLDEVDPESVLPILERQRRAENAMRAHMQRMALASSRSRQKKAGT